MACVLKTFWGGWEVGGFPLYYDPGIRCSLGPITMLREKDANNLDVAVGEVVFAYLKIRNQG